MNILVEGQLVEYRDEGKGRTVVLLHGWGLSLTTFKDLSAHLSNKFRVISLDLPGFGASPKPTSDWGAEEYATFVEAFVKKLKLDSVYTYIGHSFGGRIIIRGSADGLLLSEKVVLIDTAGIKPTKTPWKTFYGILAKTGKIVTALPGLRSWRESLRKKLYNATGTSDYLQSGDMKQIFLKIINEDLLPYVHLIKQPTLIIWGERDYVTPLSDAQAIKDELPNGRLVVIPDAGHFPYLDDLEAVKKELDAFV
jgi:pimeloyl-ACP methyl ester carboxylesterase